MPCYPVLLVEECGENRTQLLLIQKVLNFSVNLVVTIWEARPRQCSLQSLFTGVQTPENDTILVAAVLTTMKSFDDHHLSVWYGQNFGSDRNEAKSMITKTKTWEWEGAQDSPGGLPRKLQNIGYTGPNSSDQSCNGLHLSLVCTGRML